MKSIAFAIVFVLNLQPAIAETKDQIIDLQVTEMGFEPNSVDVKPGIPVVLKVTRKTDSTCATKIKIQSKKIERDLPLNSPVTIALGKLDKGEIHFGCGMDMITGSIFVR